MIRNRIIETSFLEIVFKFYLSLLQACHPDSVSYGWLLKMLKILIFTDFMEFFVEVSVMTFKNFSKIKKNCPIGLLITVKSNMAFFRSAGRSNFKFCSLTQQLEKKRLKNNTWSKFRTKLQLILKFKAKKNRIQWSLKIYLLVETVRGNDLHFSFHTWNMRFKFGYGLRKQKIVLIEKFPRKNI